MGLVIWNGEKYVRHCLRALAKQTYQNFEVVIFDNASTDSTVKIIATEFPYYRLIRNEKNIGMWNGHEKLLAQA